jgi:hypothetical protein
MTDVPPNSHSSKGDLPSEIPTRPEIRKIIDGEAIKRKNGLGTRLRNAFIADSMDVVGDYVMKEVVLPRLRQMAVDSINAAAERTFLGGPVISASGRESRGRSVYGREGRASKYRGHRGPVQQPSVATVAGSRYNYIINTHAEVVRVVDIMSELCRIDGYVRAGDYLELIGEPITPQDWQWGWTSMGQVRIRQTRDGWTIDFPVEEPVPPAR